MFCPCEKGGESQKKGKWGEEEGKEGNASNVFKACLQRTLTFLTKQEFFCELQQRQKICGSGSFPLARPANAPANAYLLESTLWELAC